MGGGGGDPGGGVGCGKDQGGGSEVSNDNTPKKSQTTWDFLFLFSLFPFFSFFPFPLCFFVVTVLP